MYAHRQSDTSPSQTHTQSQPANKYKTRQVWGKSLINVYYLTLTEPSRCNSRLGIDYQSHLVRIPGVHPLRGHHVCALWLLSRPNDSSIAQALKNSHAMALLDTRACYELLASRNDVGFNTSLGGQVGSSPGSWCGGLCSTSAWRISPRSAASIDSRPMQ